jgi:hypothetical protein
MRARVGDAGVAEPDVAVSGSEPYSRDGQNFSRLLDHSSIYAFIDDSTVRLAG